MLKYRILTASILIPLVIAGIFFLSQWAFAFTAGIVMLWAAWEWSYLAGLSEAWQRIVYVIAHGIVLVASLWVPIFFILIASCVWWIFASAMVIICTPERLEKWQAHYLWQRAAGFFMIAPCWVAMITIRNQPEGSLWLLMVMLLVWGADIFAYFAGRLWGKHKFAPFVSPNKSVEGLMGAFAAVIVWVLLNMFIFSLSGDSLLRMTLLGLITTVFSVAGDLFESLLKRLRGVKDSGTLLAGHGGILDRIDSLTAALPVFALGLWIGAII